MATVRVGSLQFKAYAAAKPLAISPSGEFVTAQQLVAAPSFTLGSLFALSDDLQVKLTVERNKLEPDYRLGIVGVGALTRDEVVEQVRARTELGQEFVRAEVNYCNTLMADLGVPAPATPKVPVPKPAPRPADWQWIPPKWWKDWSKYFRNCALFCENSTDAVTQYAASYRIANAHPAFATRGFCVKVLTGTNDVRANFAPAAKPGRVVYISGIGHGSPDTYTGHLNDPILRVGNYDPAEVKPKVIHLLSCQTARMLGADLVAKGAKAYAGYFENFTFVYDDPGTPADEMDLFWKSDSTFDLMMASGATVEAAHNATIDAYNSARAQVPGSAAATWLTWDRDCFRSPVTDPKYGDKTVCISAYLLPPYTPFMEAEAAMPELMQV